MKPLLATSISLLAGLVMTSAHAQTGTATIDKPVNLPNTSVISFADGSYAPADIDFQKITHAYKATVLVFVANRCGVTWLYGDKIARAINIYKNKSVKFVAVHSNYEESGQEIVAGLKEHKVPIDLIDDKPTQKIAGYFGATVTPYFVVIDQKGILRYKGPFDKMGGSMPESKRPQYLRPALDALLAGKPVAQKTVRALGCEITRRKK